ncbi:hypothetical protein GCM10018987_17210 [Streptomyces cremeus]
MIDCDDRNGAKGTHRPNPACFQLPGRDAQCAGTGVEGGDVRTPGGEQQEVLDLSVRVTVPAGPLGVPAVEHAGERGGGGGVRVDVSVLGEGGERGGASAVAPVLEGGALDDVALAAVLGELRAADDAVDAGEGPADADRAQLYQVADEGDLRVSGRRVAQQDGQGAVVDHRGLVDHQDADSGQAAAAGDVAGPGGGLAVDARLGREVCRGERRRRYSGGSHRPGPGPGRHGPGAPRGDHRTEEGGSAAGTGENPGHGPSRLPPPDHREAARQAVIRLTAPRTRRHHTSRAHE